MNKNKLKNIAGLTLIEMMIGVIITSIIMAAMYTTYSVVNKTYSQVTDRAKISRSGRDIIEMLMRDVRMSGFTYFLGINDRSYPTETYLEFLGGDVAPIDSHDPLIIIKNQLGHARLPAGSAPTPVTKWDAADMCCDKIHIVYDDFNQNDLNQPYKRYKTTYYAAPVDEGGDTRYAVYKTVQSWRQNLDQETGTWVSDCSECYVGQKIRDHIVDMEFIPLDASGKRIFPIPKPGEDSAAMANLYKIRAVDVRITFRSKKEFYRYKANAATPRLVKALGNRTRAFLDKYLRDSVVVTIHTRNIGSGI